MNTLPINKHLVPKPYTKQLKIGTEQSGIHYIKSSHPISSSLKLTNLTLTKDAYCVELDHDQEAWLDVKEQNPYWIFCTRIEPIDFLGNDSFRIFADNPLVLRFSEPTLFTIHFENSGDVRLLDDESNVIYSGQTLSEIEIDYQGDWILIDNPNQQVLQLTVASNVNAN